MKLLSLTYEIFSSTEDTTPTTGFSKHVTIPDNITTPIQLTTILKNELKLTATAKTAEKLFIDKKEVTNDSTIDLSKMKATYQWFMSNDTPKTVLGAKVKPASAREIRDPKKFSVYKKK